MEYLRPSIAAFLLLSTLLYACKTAEVAPTNRVALKADQSARLQNNVTVRVDSLTDSRCPEGVTCIWEGNSVVNTTLSKAADKAQVRLILGRDITAKGNHPRADSTSVVLVGETYKVVLRDVTPYPSVKQPASPATQAIIEVSKL
ncbi:hypothetical protein [Fibrella aquatica]|uniref:hypothetical protein n=1 Tax=Fibrella aquatica TaxID=3242487 RepID=UPI00351F8F70